MRITICHDDGPEDCIDAVCSTLISLGVEYTIINDDTKVHIDYQTSKEKINKYEEIQIDFDNDTLFKLMLMAHEQDITLNQFIENILREQIEKEEKNAKH